MEGTRAGPACDLVESPSERYHGPAARGSRLPEGSGPSWEHSCTPGHPMPPRPTAAPPPCHCSTQSQLRAQPCPGDRSPDPLDPSPSGPTRAWTPPGQAPGSSPKAHLAVGRRPPTSCLWLTSRPGWGCGQGPDVCTEESGARPENLSFASSWWNSFPLPGEEAVPEPGRVPCGPHGCPFIPTRWGPRTLLPVSPTGRL